MDAGQLVPKELQRFKVTFVTGIKDSGVRPRRQATFVTKAIEQKR
jgi:hypothetical protein